MNFVGLDIPKKFTYGIIKDKEGNILNESRFDNCEENFNSFFKRFDPENTRVVMESTGVWEWIYDLLEERGYKAKVANPLKTKAIAYAKTKTDSIDAGILADLNRADMIAESYVPPKEIRRLRDVVRQRRALVKGKTQTINKIRAILIRHGIKLPFVTVCDSAMQWVIDEMNNLTIKSILVSYINLLRDYRFELKNIEEKIKDLACSNEQAQLLMTIPGIGGIMAMEILAEIGNIDRFPEAAKLCCYAGLVPNIKQSGETLRVGRLIKQANKGLKFVFIEAAWHVVRKKESNQLKEQFKRLSKKKGKQKAICAIARKLCCITYSMLRKNQEFMVL